jgi:hypothetical protein
LSNPGRCKQPPALAKPPPEDMAKLKGQGTDNLQFVASLGTQNHRRRTYGRLVEEEQPVRSAYSARLN